MPPLPWLRADGRRPGAALRAISPAREEPGSVYRFKIFHSGDCNGDIQLLEAKVNAWIEADRPRIRLMCQTPIGNEVLLSFAFEFISEVDDQPAISITAVPDVFQ